MAAARRACGEGARRRRADGGRQACLQGGARRCAAETRGWGPPGMPAGRARQKVAFVWLKSAENTKSLVCVVGICREKGCLAGVANGEQALLQKNRRSKARSLSAAFSYEIIFHNLRPYRAPVDGFPTTQTELFAKMPLLNHTNASFCTDFPAKKSHRSSKGRPKAFKVPDIALMRTDKLLLARQSAHVGVRAIVI